VVRSTDASRPADGPQSICSRGSRIRGISFARHSSFHCANSTDPVPRSREELATYLGLKGSSRAPHPPRVLPYAPANEPIGRSLTTR